MQLQAITRAVPAGEHTTLTVDGSHVTFTPQTRGDYWYQIHADDGKNHSADFNLALPAFDPALKRDDSHALLLYRFNEGTGSVVHDRRRHRAAPRSDHSRRRQRAMAAGSWSHAAWADPHSIDRSGDEADGAGHSQGLHHRSLDQHRYPVPPLGLVRHAC